MRIEDWRRFNYLPVGDDGDPREIHLGERVVIEQSDGGTLMRLWKREGGDYYLQQLDCDGVTLRLTHMESDAARTAAQQLGYDLDLLEAQMDDVDNLDPGEIYYFFRE